MNTRVHIASMIRTVLLDVDGTLVDSNESHAQSWHETLTRFGVASDLEALRRMIGMGGDKLLAEFLDDPDGARAKEIRNARGENFINEHVPSLRAFRGVREFVEKVIARGLTPVVASSANARELGLLLKKAGVDDLLQLRTGSDDAEHSKPDPDIVQVALERAKTSPSEAVLIGDTPYDRDAAKRAGVAFIGVRSGGWSDEDLQGAAETYADVAELLANFDRSLLAR